MFMKCPGRFEFYVSHTEMAATCRSRSATDGGGRAAGAVRLTPYDDRSPKLGLGPQKSTFSPVRLIIASLQGWPLHAVS